MNNLERRELRYQRRKDQRLEKLKEMNLSFCNFEEVFSFSNLYKSYKKCCKGVGWKASTQNYKSQALLYVNQAFNDVRKPDYCGRGFICFESILRGKHRNIKSVHITERVIQRCFCDYCLVPLFRRYFIYDNYSSLKNRGISLAIKRTKVQLIQYFREFGQEGYVLQFDISKFFESIDHSYLISKIREKLLDDRLFNLLVRFIKMFGDRSLGLGSQVSQICALLYLNELDHLVKDQLGLKYYGRYQDDGHIFHKDKEYLKEVLSKIICLCDKMGIKLNLKKTQIVKLSKGFTFLKIKYLLTDSGKIVMRPPRKSITATRRKLKKFKIWIERGKFTKRMAYDSYQSWKSYTSKYSICSKSIYNMDKLYKELFGINPGEIPK